MRTVVQYINTFEKLQAGSSGSSEFLNVRTYSGTLLERHWELPKHLLRNFQICYTFRDVGTREATSAASQDFSLSMSQSRLHFHIDNDFSKHFITAIS